MSGLELAVNKRAMQQAAGWNQAHQVGAEVVVAMPDGSARRTRTRSAAFHMFVGLKSAQVYVDGFGGMVSLARVRPVVAGAGPGKDRPSARAGNFGGRQFPATDTGERREDAWKG